MLLTRHLQRHLSSNWPFVRGEQPGLCRRCDVLGPSALGRRFAPVHAAPLLPPPFLQHILTAQEVSPLMAAAHRPNFVLQVSGRSLVGGQGRRLACSVFSRHDQGGHVTCLCVA